MIDESSHKSNSEPADGLVKAVSAGLGEGRRDLISRWSRSVASRWLLPKERFRDGPSLWMGSAAQAELAVLGVDMFEGVDAVETEPGP